MRGSTARIGFRRFSIGLRVAGWICGSGGAVGGAGVGIGLAR